MRVLVCGSREFTNNELLEDVLKEYEITEIIQGGARGADRLAKQYAIMNDIPMREFPAMWRINGKAAGPIRNHQMLAEKPDLVVAFLAPNSKGTKHMINIAEAIEIPVRIVDV